MTLTPEAHTAVDHLNIEGIDALIALTHADITWHAPEYTTRAWGSHRPTTRQTQQPHRQR